MTAPDSAAVPTVAMLASPLLGPAVWRPAADSLVARGWDVLVVPGPSKPPCGPGDVVRHLLERLPAGEPLVLVAHSNAGLYVPAVSAGRRVLASVFVDATLPESEGSVLAAPVSMHGFLHSLADTEGILPPWTQWWDEEVMAELFPDAAARATVTSEQHRLPLAYFSAAIDVPTGWTAAPAAYLAFGDTYRAHRERAQRWGWPVRTLPGGHLHQLVDPRQVAAALDDLLRQLLVHSPEQAPGRR